MLDQRVGRACALSHQCEKHTMMVQFYNLLYKCYQRQQICRLLGVPLREIHASECCRIRQEFLLNNYPCCHLLMWSRCSEVSGKQFDIWRSPPLLSAHTVNLRLRNVPCLGEHLFKDIAGAFAGGPCVTHGIDCEPSPDQEVGRPSLITLCFVCLNLV